MLCLRWVGSIEGICEKKGAKLRLSEFKNVLMLVLTSLDTGIAVRKSYLLQIKFTGIKS